MALTVSVALNITPLADNEIAFANAAAWNNYWNAVSGIATLNAIVTTLYVPTAYNSNLNYASVSIDGQQYNLCTNEMFQSLKARFETLETSYEALRTALQAGGLISQAQ